MARQNLEMNSPELVLETIGEDSYGNVSAIATAANFYTASMKHPPPLRWQCYHTGERGTIIRERVGTETYLTFLPSPYEDTPGITLPRKARITKHLRSPYLDHYTSRN
jgi:hypothetical protein